MLLDPPGTLWKVALFSVGAGAACGALAVLVLFLGSALLKPSIPPARVWAEWRLRRVLWGLTLILTASASILSADAICRRVAFRDLYWLNKAGEITQIAWLGGACGYLLVMLLFVVAGLLIRGRQKTQASPPP